MSMRNLMVALDDEGLVESLIPAVVKMAQDLGLGSIAFVAGGQVALPMTRILVAWNDTREARLAVASAMPLLLQAERVLIVGVGADSQSERLQQVADYCGLHGVYAQTKVENDVRTGDEGQALLDAADDDASRLIVSGAYGHSRLRELVLGGVTRDLLQQETRPCLFSH